MDKPFLLCWRREFWIKLIRRTKLRVTTKLTYLCCQVQQNEREEELLLKKQPTIISPNNFELRTNTRLVVTPCIQYTRGCSVVTVTLFDHRATHWTVHSFNRTLDRGQNHDKLLGVKPPAMSLAYPYSPAL